MLPAPQLEKFIMEQYFWRTESKGPFLASVALEDGEVVAGRGPAALETRQESVLEFSVRSSVVDVIVPCSFLHCICIPIWRRRYAEREGNTFYSLVLQPGCNRIIFLKIGRPWLNAASLKPHPQGDAAIPGTARGLPAGQSVTNFLELDG